jgi:hypothetical protein
MKIPFVRRFSWNMNFVTPPWGDRPSIFAHIQAQIVEGVPGLNKGGECLPDEDLQLMAGSGLQMAPGLMEGSMMHSLSDQQASEEDSHSKDETDDPENRDETARTDESEDSGPTLDTAKIAENVLIALRALADEATDENVESLYALLKEHVPLIYLQSFMEAFCGDDSVPLDRVYAIAHWLATKAADRQPVKFAIALLTVINGTDDRDLVLRLGRHEEFTFYAAIFILNREQDSQRILWELAHQVSGWGCISIIRHLRNTRDSEIQEWVLREGYRNGIDIGVTALICAQTGDLAGALRCLDPDDRIVEIAEVLLGCLFRLWEEPTGIEQYEDGPEAAELYLRHLRSREIGLTALLTIQEIKTFFETAEEHLHYRWQCRKRVIIEHVNALESRPECEERIRVGLASEDLCTFWRAVEATRLIGVDPWEFVFDRLERGEDYWDWLLRTDNAERADRVIELAQRLLPLDWIASGPARELGFGPGFDFHRSLTFIVQELRRFPGKGWRLIRASLGSPLIHNRDMAVRAIGAGGRDKWMEDTERLLQKALKIEPELHIRERIARVLCGEEVEPNCA